MRFASSLKFPSHGSLDQKGKTKPLILIKSELLPPILIFLESRLFFLVQYAGFEHKIVHLCAHKATMTVFGSANYRFTAYVEARVDNYWTTSLQAKGFDDFPVKRICLMSHRLYSGRIIHVGYRRNLRSLHIQLIDAPKRLLFHRHLSPTRLCDISYQQHIRAIGVQLEPVRDLFSQDTGRKWPETLTILDL